MDRSEWGPTPAGATISYWLGRKPADGEKVSVEVHDAAGKRIAQIREPGSELGLNEVTWNLRGSSGGAARGRGGARGGGRRGGRAGRGGGRGRSGGGAAVKPGTYRVTVKMGDVEKTAALRVVADPLIEQAGANRP